jgi:hypothetical protein
MTIRQIALVVVVCGLVGLAWGWTWWTEQHWRFKYTNEVADISELVSQYTTARLKTGRWPEPAQLYAVFFRMHSSAQSGDKRIDTYRNGPDGPWLQIDLEEDGRVRVHVTWGERKPADRLEPVLP